MPVVIDKLNFTYNAKTAFRKEALVDINLCIEDGDYWALIGHTGSGKSTLVQHLNALIRIQSGQIRVNDISLAQKKIDFKRLRADVGMVFQYPEYQLFAETVYKDVAFGPHNLKLEKEEIDRRVRDAIRRVGLEFGAVAERSPFELSGGEKRRVAIAGVIAMCPRILILDEPTSGLDPAGKREILSLIKSLKEECSPTILMINHDMDEVAQNAGKVALLADGRLVKTGTPREVFCDHELLLGLGLDVPTVAKLRQALIGKGALIGADVLDEDELVREIIKGYKSKC